MLLMYFRLFIAGLFLVIGTLIWIPICMFRPANRGNTYMIAKYYSWLTHLFLNIKIEARVKKSHKDIRNSVIISNHQSNLDIFFVGPALPKRTVSLGKQSLVWIPIFGQMYYLAGNILINRTNRTKAWKAMAEVARTIKEDNCNVWIMPEGTRSKGRGLLPFKKGPFVVAIQGQLPIYPVVFSEYDKSFDLRKLKPGKVIIEALEPISTQGLTMDDIGELMDKTREMMLAHINKLSKEVS
ncbi:1-acylglycerol-3-phosphate O-acyltransferase [Halobacteriovorax sp. XZX-3]|uniref:1-acylglycerol-3-phosphate O-acyltransferase n=1 Tax=unclassified Halobacteriovorax TaxID=2639665 RepID=UPI000CD113BE|nr:1-acylglycerol-3-phosphate O-acyltransferase [Halobacteriovorax sp. DA5]POB13673.1 1-acyl-sn-glycerol-3-phosphate acyltransferase [Halobacteriovorax sp. DA5]